MTDLHNTDTAIEFYENRYEDGYMEEWDDSKKEKIFHIIKSLNLPATGKALDFGCGNGVFTNVIKTALPGWEVFGVEISQTAVQNASRKFPQCKFFLSTESADHNTQFDLLFSHHVIEHVQDLGDTFETINAYLKQNSSQLHVLPCGNEGSYEHQICMLRKDGFKENGLFFFEEPGHLQRLNTKSFSKLEQSIGFELTRQWYSNQHDGAVDWITKSSPRFVKRLTDAGTAKDQESANKLTELRSYLLPLTYRQFAYSKYLLIKNKWKKSLVDKIKLGVFSIPAALSKPTFKIIQRKADQEWKERSSDPKGSEMFLYFNRNNS